MKWSHWRCKSWTHAPELSSMGLYQFLKQQPLKHSMKYYIHKLNWDVIQIARTLKLYMSIMQNNHNLFLHGLKHTCGKSSRDICIPYSTMVLSNFLLSKRPNKRHKQFIKNFLVSTPPSLLSLCPPIWLSV